MVALFGTEIKAFCIIQVSRVAALCCHRDFSSAQISVPEVGEISVPVALHVSLSRFSFSYRVRSMIISSPDSIKTFVFSPDYELPGWTGTRLWPSLFPCEVPDQFLSWRDIRQARCDGSHFADREVGGWWVCSSKPVEINCRLAGACDQRETEAPDGTIWGVAAVVEQEVTGEFYLLPRWYGCNAFCHFSSATSAAWSMKAEMLLSSLSSLTPTSPRPLKMIREVRTRKLSQKGLLYPSGIILFAEDCVFQRMLVFAEKFA